MSEEVKGGLEEAEKVVKKQKVCVASMDAYISQVLEVIQAARREIESGTADPRQSMRVLSGSLKAQEFGKKVPKDIKDYHKSVGNLGKIIEGSFVVDVHKACRPIQFDKKALDQVVAEHLFREGKFDVGDTFVSEAGLPGGTSLKDPYLELHQVLQQMHLKNLAPALQWAHDHREQLSPNGEPSLFEFKLHRLQYIRILDQQGQLAALQYGRQVFPQFAKVAMREVEQLMGCLAYAHCLERSPYEHLLSAEQWHEVAHEFVGKSCSLLGQACESPLLVSVAAGSAALPGLLKISQVLSRKGMKDPSECHQLPVELELGREFVFHSIFACPVSKDQSTPDNPPMMLPCGHVLCRQALKFIAKDMSNRAFKCPYCPTETTLSNCRKLIFPDNDPL